MPAPITVSIVPAAPETRPTIVQLVQLYLHDLSAAEDWDVEETGGFGADLLRGCWSDPRRHPSLIRADGRLAGFAVVDQGSHLRDDPDVFDMAEFFVLRRWRRLGVGLRAVHQLTRRFPGQWEIRPFPGYEPAERFWSVVCAEVSTAGVSPRDLRTSRAVGKVTSSSGRLLYGRTGSGWAIRGALAEVHAGHTRTLVAADARVNQAQRRVDVRFPG